MDEQGHENRALALSDIDPKTVNALLPTTEVQQVSPLHSLSVTLVHASVDPQAGDVYKQGSAKIGDRYVDLFSPTKVLLEKFAKAAGITWDPRQSGPITPSVCQKCQDGHRAAGKPTPCVGCPHEYDVAHRAVGAIQTPTGQYIVKDATYELDFVALEEEALLNEQEKNARRKPDERQTEEALKARVRKAIAQKRRHRSALAETGAQDRVIRKLLSTKSTYTPAELSKPFAVPQISFRPDLSDPETKRAFVAAAVKAATDVFGQGARNEINITPQEAAEAEATVNAMRGMPSVPPRDTRPQAAEPEDVRHAPSQEDAPMEFDGEIVTDADSGPSDDEATAEAASEPGLEFHTDSVIPIEGRDYLMCENPDCPSPEIWRVEGMTCEQMRDELVKHHGKVLCRECRRKQKRIQTAQQAQTQLNT